MEWLSRLEHCLIPLPSLPLWSMLSSTFPFEFFPQEKVFELMTALHTKLEGFHTQIAK